MAKKKLSGKKSSAKKKAVKKRPAKRRVVAARGGDSFGGMSSAAVEKGSGKGWAAWLKALDAAGCKALSHKDIAALVHERFGVSSWWSQMVTVGYEQARGLRVKHQKADGFSVSVSRTFEGTVGKFFDCFADEAMRAEWMPGAPVTVTKATKGKSVRIAWGAAAGKGVVSPAGTSKDGTTRVEVNFYAKAKGKAQVTVQHNKMLHEADVEKVRGYWAGRMDALGEATRH